MPVSVWARLRRRWNRRRSVLGGVAGAALRGEPLAKILTLGAQSLMQACAADRVGVWRRISVDAGRLEGIVLEAGPGLVPEEWIHLDEALNFVRRALESRQPLQWESTVNPELFAQDLLSGGPLAGMSRALWIPLRQHERILGLALLAFREQRNVIGLERACALADEIALSIAEALDRDLLRQREQEDAAIREVQLALLRGAPVEQILNQVANGAACHSGAEFVALGALEATHSEAPDFTVFAGERDWVSFLPHEPFQGIWRGALEQGRGVRIGEAALRGMGLGREGMPARGLSRLLTLPLQANGERLGVLVAGWTAGVEPCGETERLVNWGGLAATALWENRLRRLLSGAESTSRSLLEANPDGMLIVDPAGVVCEVNQTARDRLGLERGLLDRVPLENVFPPATREAVAAWSRAALGSEPAAAPAPLELELPGGTRVCLHLREEFPIQAGERGRRQIFLRDVTELRAAERQTRRALAELHGLIDAVENGVLIFDAEGRIRRVNDRFAQLLGLDARQISELGRMEALVEMLAGQFRDPAAFVSRWREVVQAVDEAACDELELLHPSRRVLERFVRPVFTPEGERQGWIEIYRDLTGQRLIHSKLLQTEKMAALGQLVSGIAHELNNPLTSIMGYAQLLLGRKMEPELLTDARMIYQEAERAGRIVRNLLLFARGAKPERRPVNLNEIVERTVALRSYELRIENIAVELELDPQLPETLADAAQMQQVVLNLVVNAEQAIQQGRGKGRIRVHTQRLSDQRIALEVADDGPGIPPPVASRIFDPFFTTKPAGIGTGLGLSIVYGIVQEHGGEISVSSQPGRGAAFWIELPVVASPESAEAEPAPAAQIHAVVLPGQRDPASAGRRERVLVIEDEPTVAQLIADVLGEMGHEVETVLDSREGLERVSREEYDLLICDLKMPHLDGRGFYRALVRAGSHLQHRLVFVTGDTLTPHTVEFLEKCGVPYLAKPFLVEELKQLVQQALSPTAPALRMVAGAEASGWPRDATRKR